ncbi:Heat-labile enterotoxin, A chain [Cordyceps javanica]|uniref:Heat-labile enterotoxin, A chain n=1 Tax=Cordyceps javanica TaxID=43265 RepID=A0A545VZS8_9HYPO|nr:Heat-labile enterotoxin, A chain [Cordyceps javanica]TQW07223.1 Heat-labile enterotoxin, A chain [Cordyceps javanica]
MLILRRAFLLGLAAAHLVASRATGNAPDHDHILKRGVPEPQGDIRIPKEIVLGSETWTRAEILAAIDKPVNPPKPFGNHGVEWKSNKWVPKKTLFEGVGSKLTEYDLTRNPAVRGKFRAITTANKNFIGITEHAADNNVKSIWDVKALTREGQWVKLGVSGDRVTGTNGLHFARKDIAAAMQSQAKDKVSGKLWKSKISPMGGGNTDVFNVVYEGNEFKYIEDTSGAKVFEKPGPVCKRDATKRACGLGEDILKSIVTDGEGTTNTKQGNSKANPGEEVGSIGKPTNTKGGKPVSELAIPKSQQVQTSKLAKLAEGLSQKEFESLANSRGLLTSITETSGYSVNDIRTKVLGYKPLSPESASFKIRPAKLASGAATSALTVAGVTLWVKGIVDAFESDDANGLDKAAAVTAIIPFVGCTTNLAVETLRGYIDVLDAMLCYSGDALFLTPVPELGLVLHIIRGILSLAKLPTAPGKEVFLQHRDSRWHQFLGDNVYTYIYSDTGKPFPSKEKSFREKLNSSLTVQGLAVISEGAERIGAVQALSQIAIEESHNTTEKDEITKMALEAADQLRAAAWNETIRTQRTYLLKLPDVLREQTTAALKPIADTFNEDYIKGVTSPETAAHYSSRGLSVLNGTTTTVEEELNSVGAYLKTKPPPLPKAFVLAYILGQSNGLEGLDPLVLSPRHYLAEQSEPKLSEDRINFFSLYHSLEVVKLLQGRVEEGELRNPWRSDIRDARPLHLLIAMRYGQVFQQQKGSWHSGPDIPPVINRESLAGTAMLAAVTLLEEGVVQNLPKEGQFLSYKQLASEDMILSMLRLAKEQYGYRQQPHATKRSEI